MLKDRTAFSGFSASDIAADRRLALRIGLGSLAIGPAEIRHPTSFSVCPTL